MKKIICFILVSVFVLTMASGAFAEEINVSADDINFSLEGINDKLISLKKDDLEVMAVDGADKVTIKGNTYIADTGEITIKMELNPDLGFICISQDLMASLENYFMLSDDPEGLMYALIDAGVHFLLLSIYTFAEVHVSTDVPDGFSTMVGTLSEQSDLMKEAFTQVFAEGSGFEKYEVKDIGANTWMVLDDYFYLTFIDGHYVIVTYATEDGTITDDDRQDINDLLSGMTFSAK